MVPDWWLIAVDAEDSLHMISMCLLLFCFSILFVGPLIRCLEKQVFGSVFMSNLHPSFSSINFSEVDRLLRILRLPFTGIVLSCHHYETLNRFFRFVGVLWRGSFGWKQQRVCMSFCLFVSSRQDTFTFVGVSSCNWGWKANSNIVILLRRNQISMKIRDYFFLPFLWFEMSEFTTLMSILTGMKWHPTLDFFVQSEY